MLVCSYTNHTRHDPLQTDQVFFDVVHFGYLQGNVVREVGYLAGERIKIVTLLN